MDLRADAGTLSTNSTVEGPSLKQELSLPSACCQTESGGTILLQLLEFKTHLLEAVEELHIRRDAETRFEDQISKLVLEKQELEWEKESFQHQTETVANQHKESLINVRKQFQAKTRSIEEEKGKYQVSAELKDKEINNLKEELKSLQLLKYNLEKKTSELEQKLALQIRSKDSHLNQLGEVEKRFSALSRQCAMVKQAHEKLEQNVDEAMKRNKKLTSVNEKQEATIVSLKKELEEVSNKLIKAKMSSVRHEKSYSPTGREQCIQQLQQKLNMENEMSKKLEEENVAVRAEKQEVMRSLQHTQQLLLSQTQTVSRGELQLQTQRKQYQALKQEHEVMREKTKAAEDKLAQMMESCSASKTSWDKEKAKLLHRIKSEQQELHAVDEAYNELHQKHTELSSQAEVQAQLIHEFERRDSRQSFSVSTQVFPTLVEEVRGEETISSSEPRRFGSLQLLASTQAEESDCLEDTGAVTKLVAIGAPGGQDTPNQHQLSECKRPLKPSDLQTYSLTTNSICSLSETTGCDSSMSNKHINTSKTRESDPDVGSHLTHTSSFVSDDGLLISKSTRLSDTSAAPSTSQKSVEGSLDLLSKDKSDGGVSEKEQGRKDDEKGCKNCNEEQERNEEKQRNKEVHREDAKEAGSAAETRGMAQTTDRADRQEDSQRSTEDAVDTKQPETETKDRAEAEGTDGAEERGKPGLHTPETQIPAQTTTDTTAEKSDTQQVIDFMASEPPLAAWETSDFSLSFSQRVSEKVADCIHLNEGYEISREMHSVCSVEHHSVSVGQHEEQRFCHDEAQDFQVIEKPSDRSVVNVTTELSEPLNQSSVCSSQTAAFPALSDNIVSSQEFETTTKQTQLSNPSDITSNMKPKDELCNTDLKEDCVLVGTMVEPHALPQSQEISEQERGQLSSLVTVNDKDDSSAYKKMGGQSNEDACEDDACLTVQESVEKSNLNDTCVDLTMDTEDLEFEAQTDSCQEQLKTVEVEDTGEAKTAKSRAESKPSAHPSHKNDVLPETSSGKCYEESPAKEMLLDDTNELPLPRNKSYRSSFDWGTAQRKTGSMSEKNTSGPGGFLGHPSSTIPTFLKSKHNKVPLVVTRASDLLNVSSVSGTAASSRRHQQGEWRPMGDTYRETATCYEESRASLLTSSVSRLPWQTTPGCSRAPTSAAGPSLESDRDLSWSQEREDQQSSLRAQISKIEHFLNTERLRLHKRRRIDN